MPSHRFVKSDGTTLAVTMLKQQQVNDARYDLGLLQPPGGSNALLSGTGKAGPPQAQADFYITASTQSAARLAADALYSFAKDSVWLERVLDSGAVYPEARLAGGGEGVVTKRVSALTPYGTKFRVSLTLGATSAGQRWAYVVDASGTGVADASGAVLIGLGD